jgi:hypothetical protein
MTVNIVGASSGQPNIVDSDGEKRPVMTSGYSEAKDTPGETWCVSTVFPLLDFQDQVDLIFQLHDPRTWEPWLTKEYRRVVTAFPGPFRQFPWKAMFEKYGPVFGSSIAWMMAYAIESGARVINIFGVDMATRTEYAEQRDTFFYWAGRAEAAGIQVNIPVKSRAFFKDRLYGVVYGQTEKNR